MPLTLGRLEPDTEICIVEMGMRGFGQIAELCEIARPRHRRDHRDRAGPPRARRLGRRRRALEGGARRRAARGRDRGRARVADLEPHLRDDIEIRRVGPVDVELRDDGAHVAFGGGRIRFPFTSRHQAQNALTALTAYDALGLPLDRLAESAAAVQLSPLARRGDRASRRRLRRQRRLQREPDLDAGGAARTSPSAGRGGGSSRSSAAWPSSASTPTRHHREIAELAAELGIEVVAVGELARGYGAATWVPDAAAALAAARELVRPGDAVLVKASRAVALEGIAPALANVTRVMVRVLIAGLIAMVDLGRDRPEVHRVPAPERARPADPGGGAGRATSSSRERR